MIYFYNSGKSERRIRHFFQMFFVIIVTKALIVHQLYIFILLSQSAEIQYEFEY
jgi:hypothetical protein